MMKIAVQPFDALFPNKYIDRMAEAIRYAYPNANILKFPRTKNIFSLRGFDYAWLNWFENLSHRHKIKAFLSRIVCLICLNLMGIKVVSTFHNRQPHEFTNSVLDKILFWSTFRYSNKIIILSEDSKSILTEKYGKSILKKVVLIPHPTYDCKPKDNKLHDKFSILFFGHLRPYKNIELIFEIAKIHPDIQFTIAGSALNNEYEKELKTKANDVPNVNLIVSFLSTEEIDNLIDIHSILLLPYDTKSSLNSGVVIHAICKRINVIVPSIGTVNQLANRSQIFAYSYETKEDHIVELNRMITLAKKEYDTDYEKFDSRINKIYEEVTTKQNPRALITLIKQVFKENS